MTETAPETEFDLSRHQYDVNKHRKFSYSLESKYFTLFYKNKMQQMKNIKIISNDNIDCIKSTAEITRIAINPNNSASCEIQSIIDNAHSLANKKEKVLQEAKNIFTVISILNTQSQRTLLQKRKQFENIFGNL